MRSEKLIFDKLNNTRDLGKIKTIDGRLICSGKLIRSGHLFYSSEKDLQMLGILLELSVDFRTEKENIERADPRISGVENIHLPIVRDFTEGISKEKKIDSSLVKRFASDPDGARNFMINTYKYFVTDSLPLTNYSKFIKLLLKKRDKAVLWHCTAGKDRAGFASVIVQELLGVDKDSIFEDYLYTNECIKEEVSEIASGLEKKYLNPEVSSQELSVFYKTIDYLFGAKEEYLLGVYSKIEEIYGNFNGFIRNGLKISTDEIETFKNLYLF